MRYLVTGGAGFIGSHLVERLLADGHEVVAVDDLSAGRLSHLGAVLDHPGLHFVERDAADRAWMHDLAGSVDVVAHLAGPVGVARAVGDPSHTLVSGIAATLAVLSAAASHGTPTLVASSSEVYGTNPDMPLTEDHDLVLGPPSVSRWHYAGSKAVAEMLAQSLHRDQSVPTIVVRLFNTAGPRQRPDTGMVLPRFVAQALQGRPLTVHGDGRQTRCFCHVDDVTAALVDLLDEPRAYGRVVNVGSTEEVSIGRLAQVVAQRAASTSPIRRVPYDDVYGPDFRDPQRRVPDISLVHRLIGWRPTRTLTAIVDAVLADQRATQRPRQHDRPASTATSPT